MNHFEKLDNVLRYLDSFREPNTFKEDKEIQDELIKRGLNYDAFELWIILRKLYNDKYILTQKEYVSYFESDEYGMQELERLAHMFYITYDGRLFIKNNGYVRQHFHKKIRFYFDLISIILLSLGTVALAWIEIWNYCYPMCTN